MSFSFLQTNTNSNTKEMCFHQYIDRKSDLLIHILTFLPPFPLPNKTCVHLPTQKPQKYSSIDTLLHMFNSSIKQVFLFII